MIIRRYESSEESCHLHDWLFVTLEWESGECAGQEIIQKAFPKHARKAGQAKSGVKVEQEMAITLDEYSQISSIALQRYGLIDSIRLLTIRPGSAVEILDIDMKALKDIRERIVVLDREVEQVCQLLPVKLTLDL